MHLTAREESLVDAFRRLPPGMADELSALAPRLVELAATSRVDWSDAGSDADLEEFTAESLRRIEQEESEHC